MRLAPESKEQLQISAGSPRPGLLAVVRARLRAKHDSRRTEEAYVGWIRRFVRFHRKRHPRTMATLKVTSLRPRRTRR
jgi:hypothetical protein